jgi:hypothetical protein
MPTDFLAAAAGLRAHERFHPALARYCRDMARAPTADWPILKMFDQLGRYVVCYMLIHNYYAWRDAGGPAPTLSALQALVGSSARHTAGLVAALKLGGFIEIESDPADRRIKRLKPADATINEIGRSLLLFVRALDEIDGQDRASQLAAPDPLGVLIYRSAAQVLAGGTLLHGFPGVLHFTRRDCGYPLLTAVMAAHYAPAISDGEAVAPLSRRALAQRFRVSPAHIGNLFSDAEANGWFEIDRDGRVCPSAHFCAEFECWAAWQMTHFASLWARGKSQ